MNCKSINTPYKTYIDHLFWMFYRIKTPYKRILLKFNENEPGVHCLMFRIFHHYYFAIWVDGVIVMD